MPDDDSWLLHDACNLYTQKCTCYHQYEKAMHVQSIYTEAIEDKDTPMKLFPRVVPYLCSTTSLPPEVSSVHLSFEKNI